MNQVELNAFDLSPEAVRAHVARGRAERSRLIRRSMLAALRALTPKRPRMDVPTARAAGLNA